MWTFDLKSFIIAVVVYEYLYWLMFVFSLVLNEIFHDPQIRKAHSYGGGGSLNDSEDDNGEEQKSINSREIFDIPRSVI